VGLLGAFARLIDLDEFLVVWGFSSILCVGGGWRCFMDGLWLGFGDL
jgi:hypothetical protein